MNECKEKWRNIWSSFSRSLMPLPSGSKPKKPYYLEDYLQFCPMWNHLILQIIPGTFQITLQNQPTILIPTCYLGILKMMKIHTCRWPKQHRWTKREEHNSIGSQVIHSYEPSSLVRERMSGTKRRKLPISKTEKELTNYLRLKNRKLSESGATTSGSAI